MSIPPIHVPPHIKGNTRQARWLEEKYAEVTGTEVRHRNMKDWSTGERWDYVQALKRRIDRAREEKCNGTSTAELD